MVKKKADWSQADMRYGWVYGCEGFVSQIEAARMVGKSQPWMSAVLNGSDRKTPGGRGYPIRAGKNPEDDRLWEVCVRSLRVYLETRKPIEV